MSGAIFFYSDQVVPANRGIELRLLRHTGKPHPRIGYIPSASDATRKYFIDKAAYYRAYGIVDFLYFDLNKEYHPELLPELLACDIIHLSGGDPYQFNASIRKRHFAQHLREYLAQGGVIAGVSAGGIVLTPSIEISNTFYRSRVKEHAAAHLVDFHFLPHFNQRTAKISELEDFSRHHRQPLYACHDGDGIIVEGEKIEFIGDVVKFENGHMSGPGTF